MASPASIELIALLKEIEDRCLRFAAGLPQQEEIKVFWEGVVFAVSGQHLLAPLGEVKEVLNFPPGVTPVPGTQPWLRGVANIRGNLLPIVDLQAFLGGGRIQPGRRTRVLVIDQNGLYTGLMVDNVMGIRHFPEEMRTITGSVPGPVGKFIDGAFIVEKEIWPIFSMQRLAANESFQAAAA